VKSLYKSLIDQLVIYKDDIILVIYKDDIILVIYKDDFFIINL